jgi:hypothetical protein
MARGESCYVRLLTVADGRSRFTRDHGHNGTIHGSSLDRNLFEYPDRRRGSARVLVKGTSSWIMTPLACWTLLQCVPQVGRSGF